ncbi:MAG TPA: hypothetical protein VK021_03200 [Flavobacteriaceae bacterium]|nr:hypothetical protein [Flavobacteriaceae bacterium]
MKNYFLILILGICLHGFGQEKKPIQDSISKDSSRVHQDIQQNIKVKDSSDLYKDIEKYSKKSKFTQTLHKWLFREPDKRSGSTKENPSPDYSKFSDRIIREVTVESFDPFGYSLEDSTKTPHSWFQKLGNTVHIKSKPMAINKYYLFDEGQVIDTFLINETARLLRQQSYVRDVRLIPKESGHRKDSVDLKVKVLDSWSLLPKVRIGGNKTKVGLRERNFIGMGHEANLYYSKRYADGNTGFEAYYKVPNFKNTFIDAFGKYDIDLDHFYDRYVSVDKEFYSSLTRWAGGVFFQERFLERPLLDANKEFFDKTFKYRYSSIWGGYALPISKEFGVEKSNTNLIFSLRAFLLNYKRTPSEEFDPENYFANERFILGSVALSSRQFIQDAFIFRDGEVEDVPIGSLYAITSGLQRKNQKNRPYISGRATYGTYFNWGFLSTNLEAGTYFNNSKAEQTTISLKVNYFSNIWHLGNRWRVRQFIKPQVVLGFNRLSSRADRLGLNEKPYYTGVHSNEYINYGNKRRFIDYNNGNIEGFDSDILGTRKYMLEFQTQFYSPWSLFGFRINPFTNFSLGYLEGKNGVFKSNKLYSSLGLGVIVRNDYLVFRSFELSFAYYPKMPGEGNNIFRSNAFKPEDYGFQDFQVEAPRTVIYE